MINKKFQQTVDFTRVNIVLQRKNTLLGFILGIIPIVITALAIELFIGKLIGNGKDTEGLRANNIIIFTYLSAWFSSVAPCSVKFRNLLKNTPLNMEIAKLSEALIITVNAIFACLIVNIILGTEPLRVFLVIINIFIIFLSLNFVMNYVIVLPLIFFDFNRVISILFQLLFWLSPILYEIRLFDDLIAFLFCINQIGRAHV